MTLAVWPELSDTCVMGETSDFKRSADLLTALEVVAQYPDCGFSRAALWRWARDGLIRAVRYPSGRVRFRRGDVEALLEPRMPSSLPNGADLSAVSADRSDPAGVAVNRSAPSAGSADGAGSKPLSDGGCLS